MAAISFRSNNFVQGQTEVVMDRKTITTFDTTSPFQTIDNTSSRGKYSDLNGLSIRSNDFNTKKNLVLKHKTIVVESDSVSFQAPNTYTFGLGTYTINSNGAVATRPAEGELSVANSGVTLGAGWYQPLALAVNGLQLKIPTSNWTTYNNLQNTQTNIGVDLQGLVTTTEINSSDSIPITFDFETIVYMVRQTNWSGVDTSDWTSLGNAGNIIQDVSTDEAVYSKTFSPGTYNFDNYSAMYFFDPNREIEIPAAGLFNEYYTETITRDHNLLVDLQPYKEVKSLKVSNGQFRINTPSEVVSIFTNNGVKQYSQFSSIPVQVNKNFISNIPNDGFLSSGTTITLDVNYGYALFDLYAITKAETGTARIQYTKARTINSNVSGGGGGEVVVGPTQTWY